MARGDAMKERSKKARVAMAAQGGLALFAKRGREYMSTIGKRGGTATSQDRDYMSAIGKRGGEAKRAAALSVTG